MSLGLIVRPQGKNWLYTYFLKLWYMLTVYCKPYAILQFSQFLVACNNAKALLFNYQFNPFAISFLQCLSEIHKYLDELWEWKVENKIKMICIVIVSHLLNRRWYITVVTVTNKWWRYSFVSIDFLKDFWSPSYGNPFFRTLWSRGHT